MVETKDETSETVYNIVVVEPTGPTGPSQEILGLFPSAYTGPVEPPTIATLDELLLSYESTLVQETSDKLALSILKNPSRDAFRPQLFQWAGLGFPAIFVVQVFDVSPPTYCSDGISRNSVEYVNYLIIPNTLDSVLETIRSLMPGISVSFSFLGNTLRIHVSKA